jgi:hypothetical protein
MQDRFDEPALGIAEFPISSHARFRPPLYAHETANEVQPLFLRPLLVNSTLLRLQQGNDLFFDYLGFSRSDVLRMHLAVPVEQKRNRQS